MDQWKIGVVAGPVLIIAMALFMRRQRLLTAGQTILAVAVTLAVATLFLTM